MRHILILTAGKARVAETSARAESVYLIMNVKKVMMKRGRLVVVEAQEECINCWLSQIVIVVV